MAEVRLHVISQPLWAQEEAAIQRMRELIEESDTISACALVVGYYHKRRKGRAIEADLILVCDYGLFVVELKDWSGRVTFHSAGSATVEAAPPFRHPEMRDSPVGSLLPQIRLLKEVVEDRWRELVRCIFGLAVFTNPSVQLAIGPALATIATSGEVAIGSDDHILTMISVLLRELRQVGADGRGIIVMEPETVWSVAEFLSAGAEIRSEPFPRRVGDIILQRETNLWGDGTVGRWYIGIEEGTQEPLLVRETEFQALGIDEQRAAVTTQYRAAQALRKLGDHPYVLNFRVAHRSDDGRRLYVGFQWTDARPLRTYLSKSDWRLPLRLGYLANLARATRHVHSRGLIHRDICTDNLLLERKTLRPRLANFDLSRVEGLQSVLSYAQDRLQGRKSSYAAPELLRATAPDEVDASCDVYSLGVVVFEVLTRTMPTRERPDDGRGLDRMAGITAELATLVDRMLDPRTELRPTDNEIQRTLESAVEAVRPDSTK